MKEYQEELLSELLEEIITKHSDGSLISHSWLRKRCGLAIPDITEYPDTREYIEAFQAYQFAYMQLVDSLRWELLESENVYLRNVRGEGYEILNAKDQTQYGYDRFVDKLGKLMKETNLIINNVRNVDSEQRAKDNDLRAKYSAMKMMLETIKR